MQCDYCGKPLWEDLIQDGELLFCGNTDCQNMYYYEKEKDEAERGKDVW